MDIGSDGGGNPICFDTNDNDKIVLLDHEQAFEKIGVINLNIIELAECLITYKIFISTVQQENGKEAYLNSVFTEKQLTDLKNKFSQINPNIFKESDFWRNEISSLL